MAQHETSFEGAEPQSFEDYNAVNDRRRPGRTDQVNPTLVPLLRGDLLIDPPLSDVTELVESRWGVAHLVGIAAAVFASALLWAVISFVAQAMSP